MSTVNQVRAIITSVPADMLEYTTDNINWNKCNISGLPATFETISVYNIRLLNNVWFAVGNGFNQTRADASPRTQDYFFGMVLRSTDGINFTYYDPMTDKDGFQNTSQDWDLLHDIVYFNDFYLVVGRFGWTSRSTDGITWTNAQFFGTSIQGQLNVNIFDNKIIAPSNSSNQPFRSTTDGITFASHTTPWYTAQSYASFDGKLYIVGRPSSGAQGIKYSSDLTNWTTLAQTFATIYNIFEYKNKLYIIDVDTSLSSNPSRIWVSSDGINFTNINFNNSLYGRRILTNSENGGIRIDENDALYFNTYTDVSVDEYKIIKTNNFETFTIFQESLAPNALPTAYDIVFGSPPTSPVTFITGNREEENNRALLSCNITIPNIDLWTSTVLQYKLTDLDSDWVTLRNLPSSTTVVYHTNPEGYFSNGDLLYRLKTIYNGEEFLSNGFLIEGDNIARYDTTKTVEDFKVENIIYDEAANQLQVTFRYPRPTTLSSTIPRRPQFRITDVETGRVYGSSPSSNGLNTVISDFLYEETGPALFSSVLHSTPRTKMVYTLNLSVDPTAPIIRDFISGRKGVRLEWGWTPLLPSVFTMKKFTLDSGNYGYLVFYPKINNEEPVLPPEGQTELEPDSPQGDTGGTGQIETPAGGTGDTGGGNSGNTGVGVIADPIDIAPVIIVTPITDGQICLTDAEGVNLACGILPDGTPPNPFITIRKENDNIFIIYDGRVVVSYKIDPVTFPNLVNSQGWVGFFDLETEEQIDAPEGSIVSWLPEEGSDYEVSPEETEYGMSRKRPFIYGTYQQGYTLIINGTSVSVEMEPLHDDLVAADFYISGGTTVQVTPEIATIIANAGYGRYLSVVR